MRWHLPLMLLLSLAFTACSWSRAPSPPAGIAYASVTAEPAEGAAALPSRYYDEWLHSDYDVQQYDLALTLDPTTQTIGATARITALALAPLARFSLELEGLTVDAVTVDGQPATFTHSGRTLTITPTRSLAAGGSFEALVRYSGTPTVFTSIVDGQNPVPTGWVNYRGGSCVFGEPDGAAAWFPLNNYPSDKARYSVELTVPQSYSVAVGDASAQTSTDGATTYRWATASPAAGYLIAPCIGHFERADLPGATNVPLQAFYPVGLRAAAEPELAQTAAMLAFFQERFGPYPFASYTTVVIDVSNAEEGSIEAQMRALFGLETQGGVLLFRDSALGEWVVAHELAHQWFGNSVSLDDWGDLWIKEGLASYSEWLWEEHLHGPGALEAQVTPEAYRDFQRRTGGYLPGRPPVDNLYNGAIYERSRMLFHALRLSVGDTAFFAALRAFTERYRDSSVGRAEFIQTVESISGRDLTPFFEQWLYAEEAPQLPTPQSSADRTYLPTVEQKG